MSTAIALLSIAYGIGCVAALIYGITLLSEAKFERELHRQYRRVTTEEEIDRTEQETQRGLQLVKGGFLAWPALVVQGLTGLIREAETRA